MLTLIFCSVSSLTGCKPRSSEVHEEVQDSKSKDEAAATQVAINFVKALKAKKIDDLMMTVDVPFAWLIDDKFFEKTEDLKKMLQSTLDNSQDTWGITTDIIKILDRTEILNLAKGSEVIKKVIGDNGFCVILGNDKAELPMLVRIKDGKAKVVGLTL
jgi:hypothetical protein